MSRKTNHPARFSPAILSTIDQLLATYCRDLVRDIDMPGGSPRVIDPFAGVGTVLDLADAEVYDWTLNELEPEWADECAKYLLALDYQGTVLCQDWLRLGEHPSMQGAYQLCVTSPAYGNRMADSHEPSPDDTSSRITYRHRLGRPLTAGSAAGLQWGESYRDFHREAWQRVWDVLAPGGWFVLNLKDHVRDGEVQPVTGWHRAMARKIGFVEVDEIRVPVKGMRFGANHRARVEHETVTLWRKPT